MNKVLPARRRCPKAKLSFYMGVRIVLAFEAKLYNVPDRGTFRENLPIGTEIFASEYTHGFFKVRVGQVTGFVPESLIYANTDRKRVEHLLTKGNIGTSGSPIFYSDSTGEIWVRPGTETSLCRNTSPSDPIRRISDTTFVLVLDYVVHYPDPWFKVRAGEDVGFIYAYSLTFGHEAELAAPLSQMVNAGRQKAAAEEMEREQAQRARAERERLEAEKEQQRAMRAHVRAINAKYPDPSIAKKILDHKVWIGMTSEMARDSWGDPEDVNRTVTAYGTHEQWVYGSTYLYFEDGVLTSYQD